VKIKNFEDRISANGGEGKPKRKKKSRSAKTCELSREKKPMPSEKKRE